MYIKCILFNLLGFCTYAQHVYKPSNFVRYSIHQGLSNNSIHSLCEDHLGYIWCGTEEGVSRFDGNSFYNINENTRFPSINGKYIEKIKSIENQIAIISREGLSVIEPKSMNSNLYSIASSMPQEFTNATTDCISLKGGHLAICTNTGFYVYNKDKKCIFNYTHFKSSDIGNQRIFFGIDMVKLNEEEILIYVQDRHLYHFNLKNKILKSIDSLSNNPLAPFLPWDFSWTVKTQISDHEFILLNHSYNKIRYFNLETSVINETELPKEIHDLYWSSFICPINLNTFAVVGYNSGFYLFTLDRNNGKITFNLTKQLAEFRCYYLLKNSTGTLFIGTDKGLLVENKGIPYLQSMALRQNLTPENHLYVSDMHLLDNNQLLISASNKEMPLFVYNLEDAKIIKTFSLESKISHFAGIKQLSSINDEMYLLNTNTGIFYYNIKSEELHKIENLNLDDCFLPTNDHPLYIHLVSFYTGKVYKLNKKTFSIEVLQDSLNEYCKMNKSLTYDQNGNLFIYGYGIVRLDAKDQLTIIQPRQKKLKTDTYMTVSFDDQNLYVGTIKGNIYKDNLYSTKIEQVEINQNIRNVIDKMSQPLDEFIFFSSGNNFFQFNLKSQEIYNLSKLSTYPEEKITSSKYQLSTDSIFVYTATTNHLIKLAYRDRSSSHKTPFVTLIKQNDKVFCHHPAEEISIQYNNESLEFFTSTLNYNNENIQKFYKIDDEPWQAFESSIKFNLLKFGKHKLSIKYLSPRQDIKQGVMFFNLNPPFYKSLWFYLLLLTILGLVIYYELKKRWSAAKKIANLNQQLAESEIKALKSQMNPHFIFNSLNSIKGLILDNKNTDASKYLSTFSDLIRKNLSQSNKFFITLDEQLNYINQYLSIEKLRFEHLNTEIIVDANIDPFSELLPPMILQPIVENAIWHGYIQEGAQHFVRIHIGLASDYIICSVEDNGPGIHSIKENVGLSNSNNLALQNIKERIALYNLKYHLNCTIEYIDKSIYPMQHGTIVVLKFLSSNQC